MIKIIADSTCDIFRKDARELNIDIVPMKITLDGHTYIDWYDLSSDEFFALLQNSKTMPTTAQVTPQEFLEYFNRAVEEGADQILVFTISAEASGTNQSAHIAKDMLLEQHPQVRLEILDSRSFTAAFGHCVISAARMAQQGTSFDEILQKSIYDLKHTEAFFVCDTLEYLKKGGRINLATAVIGTLLNVKPILTIDGGLVVPYETVRGSKKIIPKIISILEKRTNGKGVPKFMVGHGAAGLDKVDELKDAIREKFGDEVEFEYFEIGSVVGSHSGPGLLGVIYVNPYISDRF